MHRIAYFLFISFILSFVFAEEMLAGSEQFYVTQGIFLDLNVEQEPCAQEDDVVNFACGTYEDSAQQFQLAIDKHVSENLSGLQPTGGWFNNAGTTLVRSYQSSSGIYLFAYNTGGEVTIVFTPF